MPREGADQDSPAVAAVRPRLASPEGWTPGLGRRDLPCKGGGRRGRVVPRQPELQLVQKGTVDRTPQPVVADLVEALREHVWQNAADALQGRQGHGLPAVLSGVLVAEKDRPILDREKTAIGQRHAVDRPAHGAEHRFGPVHGRFAVHDPRCRPDRLRDGEIRTFLAHEIPQETSEER